ncbi:MAG: hypothetical protein RSB14_07045, partial [Kiritimatiellia bacterium]
RHHPSYPIWHFWVHITTYMYPIWRFWVHIESDVYPIWHFRVHMSERLSHNERAEASNPFILGNVHRS